MSGIQAPPGFREMRLVLLQHGGLAGLTGKTGLAMLRHRAGPIVAVIDPDHAGQSLQHVTGIERDVPVVADLAAALPYKPEVAVVGLAPSGGRLPDPVRHDVLAALRAGLHLASGLHTRLADDPKLADARWPDRWIWDLRREPEGLNVGQARAAALPCRRLLAVGTDMAVGKMSACLSLLEAAQRTGISARCVGTGQAGILISGEGVALDAVRVDYAAGAVEAAVALCILAENDRMTPMKFGRQMVATLANADMTIIAYAGHILPAEYPTEVNAALRAFFQQS